LPFSFRSFLVKFSTPIQPFPAHNLQVLDHIGDLDLGIGACACSAIPFDLNFSRSRLGQLNPQFSPPEFPLSTTLFLKRSRLLLRLHPGANWAFSNKR
jgi:hypothetical protein